jgi:hypothetical protein
MTPGYTLVIGPVVPSRSCPEHREVVQLQAVYSFERGGLLMRSPKQVDPPIQKTGPIYSSRWPPSRLHVGPVLSICRRISQIEAPIWLSASFATTLEMSTRRKQRGGVLAPAISSSWRLSSWRPSLSLQPSLPFSPSLPCRPLDIGNLMNVHMPLIDTHIIMMTQTFQN